MPICHAHSRGLQGYAWRTLVALALGLPAPVSMVLCCLQASLPAEARRLLEGAVALDVATWPLDEAAYRLLLAGLTR